MLNKEVIISIKEKRNEIEGKILKIEKGILLQTEHDKYFMECKDIIRDILPNDSDEYHIFCRTFPRPSFQGRIKPSQQDNYATNINPLQDIIKVIDEILEENNISKLVSEKSFSAQDSFEAKRYITKILLSAKESLVVADAYADSTFFDYLDEISKNINIRVVTSDKKPIFKSLYLSYLQKENHLEARYLDVTYFNQPHDRYFMIDNLRIFHSGASLNSVGKNDFMIQELENPEVKISKINQIEQWWNDAQVFL